MRCCGFINSNDIQKYVKKGKEQKIMIQLFKTIMTI